VIVHVAREKYETRAPEVHRLGWERMTLLGYTSCLLGVAQLGVQSST
jgi:hypothetical protein